MTNNEADDCYGSMNIGESDSLCFAGVNYTVSQKNVLTLKRYSSKLYGSILTSFGRNVQNTLE